MESLIERLEKATEGSRELDAAIRFAVVGDMTRCNYEERCWCENADKPDHDNENGCGKWLGLYDERTSYPRNWEDDTRLPHYTTSLDAEIPDECIVQVKRLTVGRAVGDKWVAINLSGTDVFHGVARTEALARRIAALKARESHR
jgi:hypothetical protein